LTLGRLTIAKKGEKEKPRKKPKAPRRWKGKITEKEKPKGKMKEKN